ncbi:DUF3987 domain-containing protein [Streptomyces rimosus]|uniref:DUF3987 domain-containing protein n=1 Tax=Streptomyces rimosus TaxID=1927 RepID=UPI00373AF20A
MSLADDAPKVSATLLAEQGGRLAVMSAEGGIFDIIADRHSGTANMKVFLKGHAGDRLRVDRRIREKYADAPSALCPPRESSVITSGRL